MKQILCVLILVFNIYLSLVVQAQNLSYKSLVQNLTVTLNYWQQINVFLAYNEKLPTECKIKIIINKHIIICPAWVKILINKKQLLHWQQQQKKTGFINLYLPKIGIMHEKATITKIKKVAHKSPTNKNQHLVTAVYMRYAPVLKYKIKDIDTGEISAITATPEHKFYVTTYKKFMLISKLGPDDTITNVSNHHLKIICANNRQNHCGTAPLNSLQTVYNMEVEKAHNYFVGNIKALVHNGCDYYYKCLKCDEIHGRKKLFSTVCKLTNTKQHYILKLYQCEFCGMVDDSLLKIKEHHIIHIDTQSEHVCGLCKANHNNFIDLKSHSWMHIRNRHSIFCHQCDTRILLKNKLNNTHEHNYDWQFQKIY